MVHVACFVVLLKTEHPLKCVYGKSHVQGGYSNRPLRSFSLVAKLRLCSSSMILCWLFWLASNLVFMPYGSFGLEV